MRYENVGIIPGNFFPLQQEEEMEKINKHNT